MDTWLIIHLRGRAYVWNLGVVDDEPDTIERLVYAARLSVGFPASDDWATNGETVLEYVADNVPPREVLATSVALSPGEPHHHTLMARAVQGSREDLEAVPAAEVAEYRDQHLASQRRGMVESHAAMLAALPPAVLAEILAHPSVAKP